MHEIVLWVRNGIAGNSFDSGVAFPRYHECAARACLRWGWRCGGRMRAPPFSVGNDEIFGWTRLLRARFELGSGGKQRGASRQAYGATGTRLCWDEVAGDGVGGQKTTVDGPGTGWAMVLPWITCCERFVGRLVSRLCLHPRAWRGSTNLGG
jgi:hypothetical protein